ncbi:glycosyl transferase family 2 [Desulfosporosinus sp. Tol-M]|nr:glycosyl transferase family 2 [Desulfosporosinus sp. Tol-M]
MKILAIIPAYNEEKNIDLVVRKLRVVSPWLDILVINDGSTDKTPGIAKEAGAEVISLPVNLGIGGAVQTGFLYAWNKGYDIALQVDGDGQHRPEEIQKLIQPLLDRKVDVTIGSRFLNKTSYQMPAARRLGTCFLKKTLNKVVRKKYTDPTSGFRAYNRKALSILCHHYSIDYPEPDAIVTLLKNGLQVKEISVEMDPRGFGKSSITPFKSGYYMFKVSMAIIFNSIMGAIWRE